MCVNAIRDGRPAEYRWRSLFNAAKFGWRPLLECRAGKTRNPLKFAGMPRTPESISAVSGLKFTILWGHVEEILLFKFFFRLSIHALFAKIQPDKVVRWCRDGDFLRHFCVLYFQRVACSAFQTCILNSQGHTVCRSMVSTERPPRLGEEKRRRKKKPQGKNIMACPIP